MHAQLFVDTRRKDTQDQIEYAAKLKKLKDIGIIDKIITYDAATDIPTFNATEIIRVPTCIIITDRGSEVWLPPYLEKADEKAIGEYILGYCDLEEEDARWMEEHAKDSTVDSPSYYKQASVEAIELMKELMTPQQFEGFVWGNVIKYAYRYGKKGSRAETAAKIKQYAEWLEEEATD